MEPEKINKWVNNGIEDWLAGKGNSILLDLIPSMEKLWRKLAKKEDDFRSGEETYGYNPESVYNNMLYISDRWHCAYRLRWLIDGLKNGRI